MGVLVSRRHTDNHLFRQKIKKLYIFFLFYRGLQAVLEQNLLMKAVDMATGEWEEYIFEEVF